MAQLIRLLVFLLWYLTVSISADDAFKNVTQFVLDSFNRKNSEHLYNSAKIINGFKKNDSEPLYFMQLDIEAGCKSGEKCNPSQIICELVIKEDPLNNAREILEDKTKCAKKEAEPILPSFGHGFYEENASDEVRSIAAFAIQQSENGNIKRSVIDIMSVKRQVIGNATTLYLTLKVTRTEGSDAVLMEVCEAEVNKTGEMALESNLTCFPLSGMLPDAPLSADDVRAVAERAADELDSLSYSEFTLKLVDVLKAESTVTPGSEGVVTSLELRLVPTLCLKNVETESDTDGLYEKRQCPENTSNKRLICSVISWDRPWLDDTLYSEPSCREEPRNGTAQVEDTRNVVREIQEDNTSTMMNDEMVSVNEETSFPAIEHHSIPVVEELDPIVEQIVPDTEESRVPVVEEPVVAKQVYCTGCPVDLDVKNPGLQEYVDQAIVMIDEGSDGKYKHKVTRISKAQKQVVNGVKYILHLEVAETLCLKGSDQDRESCEPNNFGMKTCVVEFLEKPWLDTSREILSNNCTNYNNELENEIKPHFVFGNEAARQEIFDYLDAMEESEPINREVNNRDAPSYGRDGLYHPDNEPENHPVESDAEQIDIENKDDKKKKSEKSELDDEMMNVGEMPTAAATVESDESEESEERQQTDQKLKNNSDESEESSEEESSMDGIEDSFYKAAAFVVGENRNRRETTPQSNLGILKDIDDSEKELVDKLSQIAVQTLDEVDEDDKKRIVVEVLGAQKQIVNGILYHLQLRVRSTACSELGPAEPECLNDLSSPIKVCKMELHRPFTNNKQFDAKVVKSECASEATSEHKNTSRQKRSGGIVTGGIFPSNTSDPYITDLADYSVSELDKGTNSLYKQCVVRVVSASQQIMSGKNVYLTLEVADSIHRKEEIINGTCQLNDDSEHRICDVTIWDRPWVENGQEITSSNCSSFESRTKRELLTGRVKRESDIPARGAPSDADVNDPYIQEMASFALTEVEKGSNALYRQRIVRVMEARKQTVAGTLTHLTLELGYTTCRKGNSGDAETCQLKEDSNNQICYIKVWDRPWLNKREVTNMTCNPAPAENTESTTESRSKRELTGRVKRNSNIAAPGSPSDADVNDPYIQEMASFALTEVERGSNALYRQRIVRVVEARKQVVAGTLTHLTLELGYTTCRKGNSGDTETCQPKEDSNNQICYVQVWDRPWLNKREVTNMTCSAAPAENTDSTTESRSKRELTGRVKRESNIAAPGSPSDADVNDPYIQEMASFALAEVERGSNALYRQRIVRVVEARKQVVAGTLTHLTLELGYTTCRKGNSGDAETCQPKENSNNQICYIKVWDRPWLNKREVTNMTCNAAPAENTESTTESRSKREIFASRVKRDGVLVGGPAGVNVSDPQIQEMANFALAEVEKGSNSEYRQKIVKIVDAKRQVVAGTLTHLTLEVGYTACRKGSNGALETCQLKEDSNNQICVVKVWDRPWLEKREVTYISCKNSSESKVTPTANTDSPSKSRSKRALPMNRKKHSIFVGGATSTDPDDPYIQELASAALIEVDKQSNALYRQKIVRIIDARKQVVAGTLVHLTMEVGYSSCRKGHNVEIDSCPLKDESNNQICYAKVWDRPWLKQREVKNISCQSASGNRIKRKQYADAGNHGIHRGMFEEFVKKYDKKYSTDVEYKKRFRIFRANMKKVHLLQETEQGTAKYGATEFADLTEKEFKKYHLGLNPKLRNTNNIPMQKAEIPDVELPKEYDWRHYNVVTEVKNQGVCGSCWAFSVIGNVESQWALKKGKLYSLSEQELVDCDKLDQGCNGGLFDTAYEAIESLGGLETEKDYPYEGEDEKCHFKKSKVKVTIQGAVNITKNETQMAQWLYKNGPIAIGINANAMQFYMGGISHPWKFLCNPDNLDHGVLIVGYGVHTYPLFQKVLPYWIIKNSWGESWGEQGYYRVYRGDGTCGVNQDATSSVVE